MPAGESTLRDRPLRGRRGILLTKCRPRRENGAGREAMRGDSMSLKRPIITRRRLTRGSVAIPQSIDREVGVVLHR